MPGTFRNSSQVVVNKLLLEFKNSLGLARMVKHEYDDRFGKVGAKVGTSIEITDQVRLLGGQGNTIVPQAIEERGRFLRLNQHEHYAWEWDAMVTS